MNNPICKKIPSNVDGVYFVESRPLTLDDFEILDNFKMIREPGDWENAFESRISVKIKEELFQNLVESLGVKSILTSLTIERASFEYIDAARILREGRRTVERKIKVEVKYNGCRTEKQRKEKLERCRSEFLQKVFFETAKVTESLLLWVNDKLDEATTRFNWEAKRKLVDLFGNGKGLNYEWLDAECDVAQEKQEAEALNSEIEKLEKKLSAVHERTRQKRIAHIEKLLLEESGEVSYMKEVTQEVKKVFETGDGLGGTFRRFVF